MPLNTHDRRLVPAMSVKTYQYFICLIIFIVFMALQSSDAKEDDCPKLATCLKSCLSGETKNEPPGFLNERKSRKGARQSRKPGQSSDTQQSPNSIQQDQYMASYKQQKGVPKDAFANQYNKKLYNYMRGIMG